MFLASPNFESGESIPPKFTCDGDDISPALIIKDVPPQAKSLALIVDDPDAPMGTWLHWTVWNIDPAVSFIPEGTVPRGAVEGVTDFGKVGYGGPCPPSGTHRYFFKLYALDNKLNLPSGASLSDIKESIEGHILAEAQFVGTYGRE
ncbi:YbhB/YbcL family Raf kinase inhibitor-like protein [Candidatus Parcubacteria bacterium]|nr:MAG: YbhB/YbcL family Raf kinase inhibitor-like protein [Candidatus Parcubacteria bacterium]